MALDLSKYNTLIVDDVREMRNSLRAIVKSMGADKVFEAKSGAEAIEMLQLNEIDLVLCDYYLGDGRDGQQVFEEAKEFGMIEPTTAFVMITADSSMDVVMAVVEHSPDGYIIKPLNKSVLELRLEKILHKKRVFKDIEVMLCEKNYAKAIAISDLMLERHPKLRFDLSRLKADALLAAEQASAVMDLCATLSMEREIPWVTLYMGRAAYLDGKLAEARNFFARTLEQNDAQMEAYDWLIRIEQEAGDTLAAQKTLERAVNLSPKSIGRQQRLADIATDNGDFTTAKKALQAAVTLGEHSVYARADDEIDLINAVAEVDGPGEALKMLDSINQSKRGASQKDESTSWKMDLSYGQMFLANEQASKAKGAIASALETYLLEPRDSAEPAGIALAKACYRVGMIPEAKELMNRIVKENHDREDIIKLVRAMYEELGMTDLGDDLIVNARRAVVEINNNGVALARDGKLGEAIELLTRAADELPGNLTITLNVLQAVISQIKFSGASDQLEFLVNDYLQRAEKIDDAHPKLLSLREKSLSLDHAPLRQQA